MEIGSRLKGAREAKNLTLEDIQHKTKIQTRYLQAIERGNFEAMPGNFYIRAFIKEYAGAVDLDPDQLVKEHENELPAPAVEKSIHYYNGNKTREGTGKPPKGPGIFSFLPGLIVVVLIVGIVFAVWFFTQDLADNNAVGTENHQPEDIGDEVVVNQDRGLETEKQIDEEESNTSGKSEEKTEKVNGTPELKLDGTGTQGNEETATYTLTNPSEQINLQLDTDSEHWLEITTSTGDNIFAGMFNDSNAPIQKEISGTNRINIRIGEPTEIEIRINGIPVELPENANLAKVQQLTINVEKKA